MCGSVGSRESLTGQGEAAAAAGNAGVGEVAPRPEVPEWVPSGSERPTAMEMAERFKAVLESDDSGAEPAAAGACLPTATPPTAAELAAAVPLRHRAAQESVV